MDLASGEIIAGEEPDPDGFCPVGFYVPDWWDIHDGSIPPGSLYWTDDMEWPRGFRVRLGLLLGRRLFLEGPVPRSVAGGARRAHA